MKIKNYSYNDKTQLTKNINISELKCKCGNKHDIKVDIDHINKIQKFMNTYGYDKVIISSGYRCSTHDKNLGGSGSGQHTIGTATDLRFYKKGKSVSAREVCCKAQDFGFKGIGYIDSNYVHLDSRIYGIYRGDETKNRNNNVGNDFYSYFGIKNENAKQLNTNTLVNVYYRVKTQKHGWLGEIKNCNSNDNVNGYAGWENSPIIGLALKVDKGTVKYRVHVKGGNWLGWITKYDTNDYLNGFAGNNKPIDAVQIYYYTPNGIRPYKKATYKVNNYGWQHDTETTNGQDGYAGKFGNNITKLQVTIE